MGHPFRIQFPGLWVWDGLGFHGLGCLSQARGTHTHTHVRFDTVTLSVMMKQNFSALDGTDSPYTGMATVLLSERFQPTGGEARSGSKVGGRVEGGKRDDIGATWSYDDEDLISFCAGCHLRLKISLQPLGSGCRRPVAFERLRSQ